MDKKITNRIKQYLQIETNYAIIINGDYGIGKTYYIKNKLFPEVRDVEVPNSSKKEKYIPVLISLFGAKSIESIQDNFFFELYPILKKKAVKFLAGLGNRTLKYFTDSELKDVFSDVGTDSETLTNYGKILLCIDDVDRISEDLSIKDVFGFINNLVENLNAKVIIIANEDELRKQYNNGKEEIDAYSFLREKVIGISIQFSPNIEETYDEIIKKKYESERSQYYNFLEENRKYIVEQICINRHNLRNLLFFIEQFKIVYDELLVFFQENSEYQKLQTEIELSILTFSLPVSIEYKLGKINSSNFQKIESVFTTYYSSLMLSKLINPEKGENKQEKSYLDLFYEKYFNNSKIKANYYNSVFNYIIGKQGFNIDFLKEEIRTIYKIENNEIPQRETLLKELNYWNCINLSTKEYFSLTRELFIFADRGEFDLSQYATVFHYAIRFDNPLHLNVDNLVKRFRRGIVRGISRYTYQAHLKMRMSIDKSAEYYENLRDIIVFCNEINDGIQRKDNLNKVDDIFRLFKADFPAFYEKTSSSEFHLSPIFTQIKFSEIWKVIKSMKHSDIIDLAFYFENRYRPHIYEKIFPEKYFVFELKSNLESKINNPRTNKMKRIAYKFLISKLEQSLENFPKE
ncbi:hypothetical protein EZS27_019647 [termite gut metagenome]|uniref:Uncharacterized protein n=1 Tax=termite gut metagenome TaxID=433724 RepID=A0A5J4RFT3_9ZZZZ